MKPLFKHLQTMSGEKPFQKDKLSAINSESSRQSVTNKTSKTPATQSFILNNVRSQANSKVIKKTLTAQILHPLKGTIITLLFTVPQIPIQFPQIGGIFSGGKALAQTSNSCPAGTISTPIDWQPTANLQEFLTQTFNVAGIQTTFTFSDNPPPFGTVTDITPNGESRIDPDVYGGLPGPNLRWNIGFPDKNPVPPGQSSTLTITFAQPITLASPLTLLDVDRDGARDNNRIFQDRVTVTAANGGSSVGVTGAAVGANTRVTNTANSVLGQGQNENALPSSNDGNIQITPSGAVTQIRILYEPGTEYGTPGQDQTIGLARINICAPTTQLGTIGDTVYNDLNANNIQDANEPGINAVPVTLTGAGPDGQFGTNDDTTQTATTDSNGRYIFNNLPLGQYRVAVNNAPSGFSPTQTQPNPFNLTSENRSINTADFGFTQQPLGTIGDTVFRDDNGNNTQDSGEPGIRDVTVTLTGAGPDGQFGTPDDITRTTTTDDSGRYRFTNLTPGDYRVNVTTPSGLSPTLTQPNPFNLTLGQTIDTADFGFRPSTQGSIGDTVFRDLDANGTQGANEPGISGVTVTLRRPDGSTITTTTDGNGRYRFPGLPPGNYTVEVTPPNGLLQTTSTTFNVPLESGQNADYADFGFREPRGAIGDTVFRDLNGNGAQDAGEPGISGVTLNLTGAGPDGQFNTPDDIRQTTTTDNATSIVDGPGRYNFTSLPPGEYIVEAVTPPGTTPGDRAFLTTGINPFPVTLQPDQTITNVDFGFNTTGFDNNNPGSIGDTVFDDRNGDGTQQPGEPGISNVSLTLILPGADGQLGTPDDTTRTTTTDNNGIYSFANLPSTNYRVTVSPPNNFTPQPTTGNRQIDVNLQPGQSLNSVDFGFRRPGASIGDFIFNDRNGNGTPDEGEPGIPGATVILRNPQGQEISRTTTDERGNYNFPGLQPGDYIVEVVRPNDLSPTSGTTRNVSITRPNQAIVNADFGFRGARLGAGENLRLVKRITNVFRNGTSINDPRFTTFNPDDGSDDDNAPGWSQSQPVGIPRLDTPLQSGDEVEYTIYFLAEGNQLNNVRFCDAIPQGTSYNDQLAVNPPVSSDQINVLSPLTPLPNDVTNICLDRNNSNGTVIVNLGNVPGGRIGSIRFRVRIN
jgi:protocatechuate 3,4-dioxygenase beta subunit